MRKACPTSELAPGEALRLDTAPTIMVIDSDEAPNLPSVPTLQGHV
ncbi:hypothetical protein ABIE18_000517 [Arthrobacter sp. 2762]